jgi:hypothetical protein
MSGAGFQFSSSPHDEEYEFMFDAGNSENLAPITVS